ncbi:hypothetical protein [Methanobacterium alcaliphilum]|uniref:HVO_A0114 family putative DNA-binding protein n=1 Tax=Methanobacterium alcaliphilum TaxID=392018 RepID=UPI00200A2C43|nr:hypothetical protein [Methanobacterium alcaliphilum]MCK9152287.1 hypothetical protein [Methanobacterium alcaliphilum]
MIKKGGNALKIQLMRKIKGKQLVMELQTEYGSIYKLEKLYDEDVDNLKLYTDLEDWKFYSENPEDILEDGKTIISDELDLGKLELQLIEIIKEKNPSSINELTEMIDSSIGFIFPKIYKLADWDVINLIPGQKKTLKPVLKYHEVIIDN